MAVVPVAEALAAAQASSLGFGFSGAGFLIPFFLGVIDMLQRELRVMQPDMPKAGASSGTIAIMVANGIVPLNSMRGEVDQLSAYCRYHGNCYGTLQSQVNSVAERILGPDSANRTNRHGKTYIAITYPTDSGVGPAEQRRVSRFDSREDLIKAISASIYIPLWCGPELTTEFRGDDVYDGGFAGPGEGFLPCPPGVQYCVRVSGLPAGVSFLGALEDVLRGGHRPAALVAGVTANTLGGTDVAGALAAMAASRAGDKRRTLQEPGRFRQLMRALGQLVTPGEAGADIFPGRRHKLPVTDLTWSAWMLQPPEPKYVQMIFDHGRAEALSWAQEAGFAAAKSTTGRQGA